MFSSNKNTKRPMSDQNNVPSINMISEGTKIVGTLTTQKDFRISGEVEGKLHIDGKCIVSATALIKGDIIAADADIAGRVEGEITVKSKLILRQTAQVTGDIHTKVLLVEEGAKFEGACHMSSNPVEKQSKDSVNSAPLKFNKAANE
jgi:cytoskeletal protein CcmA (bactofilin family)